MEHYIAAIDVGTTGAKAMIIGTDGSVAGQGYREYGAAYPRPGWVEQDSEEIVEKTFDACRRAVEAAAVDPSQLACASFSCQRSTFGFLDDEMRMIDRRLYGWQDQRAAETIAEFRLGGVERSRAKTLSGGWQRRLSIAMALISQPQLVFLDEPTLGLDVLARRELWQVIRSLRGRVTVILTTHYLEEAEALSDRIGILSHGRLRICGTAQELCAAAGETRFEEAFIKLAGEGAQ